MDFDGLEQNFNQDLTGSSQPLHRLLRRARRAYADRDFESARRILEALARAVPDSTTILYPLACTQFRLSQYHESLEIAKRLDRLGDTRSRGLREQLDKVRASDPAGWEQSAARKPKAQSSIGSDHGHYGVNRLMMNVHVSGPTEDALALVRVARLHEVNYAFTNEVAADVAPIHITDNVDGALVCVDRSRGIRVSTYQREGICTYTGLDNGTYLLLCSLLGTTQWRTLALNPLLVAEDFHHGPPCRCLFSHQACKEDFALVLESPEVCPSCLAFYRCLGAEREVDTLTGFLKTFRTELSPLDSSSLA
jgi:hypothetical protein